MTACSVALKPSWRLAALLGTVHAAALAAAAASIAGWGLVLIVVGILVSAAATIADALQQLPSSVREFELDEDGSGCWRDRAGREHRIGVARCGWVSPALVVLGLRKGRQRWRWIVLMTDSAPAPQLRKLRVWLKWRKA